MARHGEHPAPWRIHESSSYRDGSISGFWAERNVCEYPPSQKTQRASTHDTSELRCLLFFRAFVVATFNILQRLARVSECRSSLRWMRMRLNSEPWHEKHVTPSPHIHTSPALHGTTPCRRCNPRGRRPPAPPTALPRRAQSGCQVPQPWEVSGWI